LLTLAVGGAVGPTHPPVKVLAADGVDVLGVGAVEQLPLAHATPAVHLTHLIPLPFCIFKNRFVHLKKQIYCRSLKLFNLQFALLALSF